METALVVFISVTCFAVASAWSHTAERLIRSEIFDPTIYDHLTRPSEITVVKVGLSLLAINYVNIKAQELSFTGWLTVEWEDSRLVWNVTFGKDSKSVCALSKEIWYPELFIDNSLVDVTVISSTTLLHKVSHTGRVDWQIPRIFNTHCEIDITYFPFDKQSCIIELTSSMYSTKEQLLEHLRTDVNTDELVQNGEWIYKTSSVQYKTLTEELSDGTKVLFSQLDFIIVLERRPVHYITSIIIPVMLTTYLSVVVFILPVPSGEKASYSLTVLLALAVLLTLIQEQMPSTGLHISYLSIYLSTCLALNAVCVFFTVCVIRVYHRNPEKDVPKCLQGIARCLAKMCCYNFKDDEGYIPTASPSVKANVNEDINLSLRNKSIKLRANLKDYKYIPQNINHKSEVSWRKREEDIIKYKIKHTFTWNEIAEILDFFLFITMNIVITLLLLIFMLLMTVSK